MAISKKKLISRPALMFDSEDDIIRRNYMLVPFRGQKVKVV